MGWDSFKIDEAKKQANQMSSEQKTRMKVREEVAGLTRKLKFDAMTRGTGTTPSSLINNLKKVGVKVPFGRRITPMEAQRAAQQGFLKKRAY